MDLSLSGQTSIFNGVFFVLKSLLGIERQKKLKKKIVFDSKASEPCQNIDISNVAKHRVMFVHVTFLWSSFFFNSSPCSYHGLFYGHAMFIDNSQKEARYLSSPVYRCRVWWIQN